MHKSYKTKSEKSEILDLYTQSDINNLRAELLKGQSGLCAITKESVVKPCLDHAHDSEQLVRGVLSHGVNIFVGTLESAYKRRISWWCDIPLPELLKMIADYLEKEPLPYRHKGWQKRCQVEFNKLSSKQKSQLLEHFGLPEGVNDKERKESFKNLLTKKAGLGYVKISKVLKEVRK